MKTGKTLIDKVLIMKHKIPRHADSTIGIFLVYN